MTKTVFVKPIAISCLIILFASLNLMAWMNAALAILFVVVLWAHLNLPEKFKSIALPLWFCAIVLGVAVGLYHAVGFENPTLLKVDSLYLGGKPLDIHLNLAKVIAGYSILLLMFNSQLKKSALIERFTVQISLMVACALLIVALAFWLLNLEFHLKPWEYVVIFSVSNLLAVCVVEEAFMRLLLQDRIKLFLSYVISNKVLREFFPLVIATNIFVLTHGVSSWQGIIVFGVAGFLYGLIYSLTRRLWLSVGVHFLVNFLHFTFLSYPL